MHNICSKTLHETLSELDLLALTWNVMRWIIQRLIPFCFKVISLTPKNFRNVLLCLGKLWILIPGGIHSVDRRDAPVNIWSTIHWCKRCQIYFTMYVIYLSELQESLPKQPKISVSLKNLNLLFIHLGCTRFPLKDFYSPSAFHLPIFGVALRLNPLPNRGLFLFLSVSLYFPVQFQICCFSD